MSNKHRREVTIEILVGLFMFTVLIALGVFTIVLSRENFLKQSYPYEFVFSEISGLREGDNVFLRGMNVGRVKQTQLENSRVHVFVTLDVPISLRSGYRVEVVDSSMLGGKTLKVYEGPEDAPLLGDNLTIIGETPLDVIQELGDAVHELKNLIGSVGRGEGALGKLMREETMYDNLLQVSTDLKTITARIERGEGAVGKLIADDAVYDNASVLMSNLRDMSDKLVAGEGTLGKLFQDETIYDDAKNVMANLNEVSDRLANGTGTLGKLMSEDDRLYEDLSATMAAARGISESINAGEGSLGQLVRDTKLYDEATMLVEDVRAAVDDLREASPITSFGSVIFGAF